MKRKIKRRSKYCVYILRCNDGTYYTGYTNNLEERIRLHNRGYGAKYLRGKGPVELVWVKGYKCFKRAMEKEREIKIMTRQQKQELIKIYGSAK